jgi:hypothetical protein
MRSTAVVAAWRSGTTSTTARRAELEPGRARLALVAAGGERLDATDVACTPVGT